MFLGCGDQPGRDTQLHRWARGFADALSSYAIGGAYFNFVMDEGPDVARACYRDNYERLAAIKALYDPDNVFHTNQNIQPQHADVDTRNPA